MDYVDEICEGVDGVVRMQIRKEGYIENRKDWLKRGECQVVNGRFLFLAATEPDIDVICRFVAVGAHRLSAQ